MSQFQTYQSFNLQNRVVALRQELINLKSPQFYDMTQVARHETPSLSVTLQEVPNISYIDLRFSQAITLLFTGENVDKAAIGQPFARKNNADYFIRSWTVKNDSSLGQHQILFWCWFLSTAADTVQVRVNANMPGVIQITSQERYDYPWL